MNQARKLIPFSRFARRIIRTLLLAVTTAFSCAADQPGNPYSAWAKGPAGDSNYFPIAVWLQNPSNAERYKQAGINLFVGLWRGPTSDQLEALEKAGMPVICAQTAYALEHKENKTIVGWMHNDEPDNAQALRDRPGYGPPVLPAKIRADYARMRAADPSRPVFLNLGQGVAWDDYIGRGVRRNHPEDYPEYIQGADIVSFDIYPVVHEKPEISGKLEYVARGVSRLVEWSRGQKIVWNCIEASRIGNEKVKPTAGQIRSEVWMSLIHGSRGIVYFVHQFKPVFREASLLDDPELLAGVTAINRQIHQLAPVLNSPSVMNVVQVAARPPEDQVAMMVKKLDRRLFVFAVSMQNRPSAATFHAEQLRTGMRVEVIGESRKISAGDGQFHDEFGPYGVHLYEFSF